MGNDNFKERHPDIDTSQQLFQYIRVNRMNEMHG